MFIPEFWCGVIATVLSEFFTLVIYSVYINMKGKKDGSNNGNKSNE